MATPRYLLVDDEQPLHYHIVSRCVRRAYLCGVDPLTGRDCSHRKHWLEDHLIFLAGQYGVELHSFAIMSNHFHLVVYFDPLAHRRWSAEEVADRWFAAHPPRRGLKQSAERYARRVENLKADLLSDPELLAIRRAKLGSLSEFMQALKQPIAARANREDEVTGHFFEQRFYSGALLDDDAVLAAMAYVDLNPAKADLHATVATSDHSSVAKRLVGFDNSRERLDEYLAPIANGIAPRDPSPDETSLEAAEGDDVDTKRHHGPPITLRHYLALLDSLLDSVRGDVPKSASVIHRWLGRLALFDRLQRAYGPAAQLHEWIAMREFRCVESAFS